MIEALKRYVKRHEKEYPTNYQLRKTINTLENEVESLREMIVEDQYEIRKLKATIKKLRNEGKQ